MAGSVIEVGTWLREHMVVFLAAVAGLTAAGRWLVRWQSRTNAERLQRIEQAAFDVSDRELDLAAKLLQTLHLSVAERQELPNGQLRLSVLVSAARSELAREAFLPSQLRPSSHFDGVVLELRDDVYWVHEQREIGVGRHGPTVSKRAESLRDAVRRYVTAQGKNEIDGVPIELDA